MWTAILWVLIVLGVVGCALVAFLFYVASGTDGRTP